MREMLRFENHTWQIMAKCEKLAGYWPYQTRTTNNTLRMLSFSLIFSVSVTLIIRLVKEWSINLDIVLENIIAILLTYSVLTKFASMCLAEKQRRKIYEQAATHFQTIFEEDETKILRDYSNQGLIFTIRYAVFLGTAAGLYDALPIMQMYFYYFFGNGILVKKFPLSVDYLVDEQEYFFYILAHLFISLSFGMVLEFAFDLTFFLTVKHISALFEFVKFRLNNASEIFKLCDENNKLLDSDELKAYEIILSAVDLHNEALDLTGLIDEAYRGGWFVILLINAFVIAPVPVLVILYRNDSFELARRSLVLIMFLVHFYVIFFQGQMTIDDSSSVFDTCWNFHWYNASKRCRNAISMMKRRSLTPCRLTGGNMFDLSMETYSMMLRTALSYVTMFAALDF